MRYVLQGHDLSHAVEEMLLHLLPREVPEIAEALADGEDGCVTWFEPLPDGREEAVCRLTRDGQTVERRRTAETANTDPLTYKSRRTEAVKLAVYDALVPAFAPAPEWGALTGVRPAKLARRMLERGMSRGEAAERLRDRFGVSRARTALTMRAAAHAQDVLGKLAPRDISLYIGVPFCPSRCSYCSFVSHSIERYAGLIAPYADALCAEIEMTGRLLDEYGLRLRSIYIGGGTPTTLSAEQLTRVMDAVRNSMDLSALAEYTVEAGRPDTITPEKLEAIRAGGADRVSINPQTMNDAVLAAIGRRHSAAAVEEAFAQARAVGFPCINMDTIAGLTGDTPASFENTIERLLALDPENITVHTLALKKGADLFDRDMARAQQETVGAMVDFSLDRLPRAGYGPYYLYRQKFMAGGFENVGWCKPGFESLYNIAMMEELQTILSCGAGGVSKTLDRATGRIERYSAPKYPLEYLDAAGRIQAGKRRILDRLYRVPTP